VAFVSARPASTELDEFYDRYHDNATFLTPPTAVASLERLIRSAEKFRRLGRWLDIGYGEGGLLEIAARRGWACYGVEVSERALEHGRRQGWAVAADPATDARFVGSAFDVVTMIECLEHQSDPLTFMRQASRWLRPGGLLYLTTPNLRSLNARVLGMVWSVVCPPEHVVLWTATALRYALTLVGLRVRSIRTEGLNPSEIVARLRPARTDDRPVDRNRSGIALSQALARTRGRRALKAVINEGLNAFGLGDTLKASAERVV
jgi:SAM-dependent methyltransferase